MTEGEKTSLTRINSKCRSLRTTVPKGIVRNFDLREGDRLSWLIKPSISGKKLMIIIKPEKTYKTKNTT